MVAVLGATLVGGHFTADPWPGGLPQLHTTRLLASLTAAIAGRPVLRLVIVGFNGNHRPTLLRNALGVPVGNCEAYDIARKHISVVSIAFTHLGAGVRPRVEFKRQTKVNIVNEAPPAMVGLVVARTGRLADVHTGALHELRRHFVNVP